VSERWATTLTKVHNVCRDGDQCIGQLRSGCINSRCSISAAVMEPLVGSEELTNPGQLKTLLASIDDVIFDCDGVLWHGEFVHIKLRAPARAVNECLCVFYS
jgi:hypothetical protein